MSGDVEDWEQTQTQGVTVKGTGSERAVEVVQKAVVEPVRMRTRAKTRTG